MIEMDLRARRGDFTLELACRIDSTWTVVFGPSGSGKTSLLRLIAGLDVPHRGRIEVDGEALTECAQRIHLAPGRRRIGYATQHPALFPHLSVAANIGYGLAALPREERNTRVAKMLDLVGAAGLAGRAPRDLSGGEAQRVALARALAPQPRLVLLDEPLSALDGPTRDQLLDRLKSRLAAQGTQTILVTHDAADALATEAEVVLLDRGRLTGQGPAAAILAAERRRLLDRLSQMTG